MSNDNVCFMASVFDFKMLKSWLDNNNELTTLCLVFELFVESSVIFSCCILKAQDYH